MLVTRGFRSVLSLGLAAGAFIASAATDRPDQAAGPLSRPSMTEVASLSSFDGMIFEPNMGQAAAEVRFFSRGSGYTVLITDHEAVFVFDQLPGQRSQRRDLRTRADLTGEAVPVEPRILRMRWVDGKSPRAARGDGRLGSVSHYLHPRGDVAPVVDVPHFERAVLEDIYPGVDLAVYGRRGCFEYDFVLRTGADPRAITLEFDGAQTISVDGDGRLLLHMGDHSLSFAAPVAYQESNGERTPVAAGYRVTDAECHRVGIDVGPYDPDRPLVIDPVFLFSTYLGGSGVEYATLIDVDGSGNVYIGGDTGSSNFPTLNPLDGSLGGSRDGFVTKMSATGALLYSTYYGDSSLEDFPHGMAVTSTGEVWLCGHSSSYASFWVIKLNAAGSSVVVNDQVTGLNAYTFLGDMAVDGSGNAFVTGETDASNFPILNALDSSYDGGSEAFLRKYAANGTLLFSTYLGGPGDQAADAVAVGPGPDHDVFLTGYLGEYPDLDAFAVSLNNAGTVLRYSVSFGGGVTERGYGIAVNSAGNAVVVGETNSSDFPTMNPIQAALGGGTDGFIYMVDSNGAPLYGTYFGTTQDDTVANIAFDPYDNIYVVGGTDDHAFTSSLSPNGTILFYSAVYGGSGYDWAEDVIADAGSNAFVAGYTNSTDFPTTSGAFQTTYRGGFRDGFVTKISHAKPDVSVANASVLEGDVGDTVLSFVVNLTAASAATSSVDYQTSNGTATTADGDYQAASGTLEIPPGQTSATIDVTVNGDIKRETSETLNLTISNPQWLTLADGQAIGTITNDDPVPVVSITDVAVTEGDSGSKTVSFVVSLSNPSYQTITVAWATANGTATAGTDYGAGSGTLTFSPGQSSKNISRSVYGDTIDENDEVFYVNLSLPTNATIADNQGVCTITDNDSEPSLSVNDPTTTEGNSAVFTVSLSHASSFTVSTSYLTVNGTAVSGADYTSDANVLSFSPGQTSKNVTIATTNDSLDEAAETFHLDLSFPTNATIADSRGTATINDNDPLPTLSIDDVEVVEEDGQAVFTVSLNTASGRSVSVGYATANGSATAGSDFQTKSGALTINAGGTAAQLAVNLVDDETDEPTETFTVILSSPGNATIADDTGTATIIGEIVFADDFESGNLGAWSANAGGSPSSQ